MENKGYRKATLIYSAMFLLIFATAYVPFFMGGRTFVTKMDGIDQYFMGFFYFGKYLRELASRVMTGDLSLRFYDLSIGMGEDIMGSLNYYGFGDPVYLVSAFFDGDLSPVVYSLSFFVRIYFAGVAFLVYCRKMNIKSMCALAGVFCYIVNGFTYGGVTSYMGWGSVLIYMPLMLTAVELIFKGEKGGVRLMLISSVYAALCGFYYLYMTCVFLVVYCLGRGIAVFGVKGFKKVIACSLAAAAVMVLGIALSGPVFFPSVSGFMGSERAHISIAAIIFDPKNWTPYLPVYLSFIGKPAEYYFKYLCKITVAEFAAVAVLFFLPKTKAKLQLCIANAVVLLTVALPITGYIFSGFGESGFEVNTRWAFLVHFLFSMTLCYVLGAPWHEAFEKPVLRRCVYCAAALTVLVSVCLTVYPNGAKKGSRLDMENVRRNLDSPVLHSQVIAGDHDVYRISLDRFMTTSDRPENTAMIRDYNGITYWLSIMNNYTQTASDELCGHAQEWRSDGFSHNGNYETAYGVKYYIGRVGSPAPDYYEERERLDYYGEEWIVYENTAWHGMARARDGAGSDRLWNTKQDYEQYFEAQRIEAAKGNGIESFFYDEAHDTVSVTTSNDAGDELVIALPFTENWKVTVDGREVLPTVKDIMCIAVNTGGGEHQVRLKYKNSGFEAGCGAFLAVALFGVVYFIRRKHGLRKDS